MPTRKTVVGMIHLKPLPGSPRFAGSLDAIILTEEDRDALFGKGAR